MSDMGQDFLAEDSDALEEPSSTHSLASPLSRRQLAWETAAVLALAVVPDWVFSIALLLWPSIKLSDFTYNSSWLIVRSLQVSAPVCYLIGRSGEAASDFGLVRPRKLLDPMLGLAVWMCVVALHAWVLRLTGAVLTDEQWERFTEGSDGLLAVARTPGEHVLSFLAQIANSFAEELVMRGYLIRRFQQLFRSTWLALLFTTVLFAGYHCYQGAFGVVNALVTGFTYGGAYCLCRRLWPVVVAHTLVNCVAEWAG